MNRQNINIAKKQTPEQIEYEELNKRMRLTTAKLRIAQEGVDVSSISQQKMDMVMRVFDEMEQIQRDTQQKTSKIQQDANAQIQKINQDAGSRFSDIQKRYQDLLKYLKENGPHEEYDINMQPIIEEVREKTHEEKVNEITDIVLRAMRDSVSNRVDEILRTVDTKAEFTIGKGVNASEETIEQLVDVANKMSAESAILDPGERPDDKDIPAITQEMITK